MTMGTTKLTAAQLAAYQQRRLARKPELYLLCGEHPAFVPPAPPAEAVRCITCEDTGRLADGRPCQFCVRPTDRPLLANDVEETTAVERMTLLELPVVA
jgi:hypothetical protein